MILRYIYIEQWGEIIDKTNINLGGEYEFNYNKDKFVITKRSEYFSNMYDDYKCVKEISAIIGKNSTGKTTILKMISDVFGDFNNRLQYIIIFEKSRNEFICYYKLKKKLEHNNIEIGIKIKYINIGIDKCLGDVLESKTNLIYFSNIFDKNKPLNHHNYLIDASTNYEIRKYINEKQYLNKVDNILLHRKVIDFINKNLDNTKEYKTLIYSKFKDFINKNKLISLNQELAIIEKFKRKEDYKKIQYMLKFNEMLKDRGERSLFPLPSEAYIYFSDDYERKQELLDSIARINYVEGYYDYLMYFEETSCELFISGINDSINKKYKFKNDKEKYINEFLYYVVIELFIFLIEEDSVFVNNCILIFDEYLMREEYDIQDTVYIILEEVIQNSRMTDQINEINIYNEDDTTELQNSIYNSISSSVDRVINLLENISNDDDIDKIEREIDGLLARIKDFNKEKEGDYTTYVKNVYKKIEEYKIEEDDYEQSIVIDEIIDIVNNIGKYIFIDYDNIEDFSNMGGLVQAIETKEINTELEVYVETKDSIIDYVKNIKELIKTFFLMMEESSTEIIIEEDGVKVKVNLNNNNVISFVNMFDDFNFATILQEFTLEELSTGHGAYLDMCARIANIILTKTIDASVENIILLIDEGDMFLHPGVQIQYISNIMKILDILFEGKHVQIILTSNSPFIVSDIPHTNIVYLKDTNAKGKLEVRDRYTLDKTFGANINNLLISNFFMDTGTIGVFAKNKINNLIDQLKPEQDYYFQNEDEIKKLIDLVGEPLVRRKLEAMFISRKNNKVNIYDEIEYYKRKIKRLEKLEI